MGRGKINKNPNHRRNNNSNDRRNENGGKNSKKVVVKEHVEEFKETFVKASNLESSHTILEEHFFDAHDGNLKSQII